MKAKSTKKSVSNVTTKKTGVQPLGDRVLIRPITEEALRKAEGKSSFGIILPDSTEKEKSAEAVVVAVGPGKFVDGKLVSIRLNVGDTVLYSKYNYDEITVDGEELYIVREETILAVITK
jgi:chaperonin GroES